MYDKEEVYVMFPNERKGLILFPELPTCFLVEGYETVVTCVYDDNDFMFKLAQKNPENKIENETRYIAYDRYSNDSYVLLDHPLLESSFRSEDDVEFFIKGAKFASQNH